MPPEVAEVGAEYVRTVMRAGAFAVRVDGEIVPLLALDAEQVGQVARLVGVGWVELIDAPIGDLHGALGLLAVAERVAGVTPSTPGSIAELVGRFVRLPAEPPENGALYGDLSDSAGGPGTAGPTIRPVRLAEAGG